MVLFLACHLDSYTAGTENGGLVGRTIARHPAEKTTRRTIRRFVEHDTSHANKARSPDVK